jgi:hypothetical protein
MTSNNNVSSVLKIKELEKEYNTVLIQYEQAYTDYINQIKQDKLNPSNKTLESLPGRSFWGDRGLKEGSVISEQACKDMCLSNEKCSGATYNAKKRYCWARAGAGLLSVTPNSTALISKGLKEIITLRKLNNRLQQINVEIATELEKSYPQAQSEKNANKEKREELKKTYVVLVDENDELEKAIKEYEAINGVYEENSLTADKESYSLRLWTLLALVLVIITISKQVGAEGPGPNGIFWIIVVIILLLTSFSLNRPQGFMLWFIVIMLVIIIKFSG